MKPAFTSHQQLLEHSQAEMAAMRQSFDRTGNGVLCIRRRALVVDSLLEPLWQFESGSALPAGLALVAIGASAARSSFPPPTSTSSIFARMNRWSGICARPSVAVAKPCGTSAYVPVP